MALWARPEFTRIATEASLDPAVRAEIEEFNRERERVRLALARLGGREVGAADKAANLAFLLGLSLLLVLRFGLEAIENLLSLELGLLLVSAKILWMMRSQVRYQHFLFWRLHALEFKQNEILRRLDALVPGRAPAPPACPEPCARAEPAEAGGAELPGAASPAGEAPIREWGESPA